jgi:tRNA threonylcarbamoyladenosine biosynthesis protein TsaB
MTTLAIDTSCEKSTLAVFNEGKIVVSCEHHSQKLQTGFFQLIEKTLDENNIQPEQVEKVVIGIGPGSFTGVRIGVSFAKTFCQLTGAKLIPVRSYYLGIDDFQPDTYYLALTPSTRFECYAALYYLDSNRTFENIHDISDGKPDRICGWLNDIPDGENLAIYGEGVGVLDGLALRDGIEISILEKNNSLPRAERALRFLGEFPDMCEVADPLALKPLYVRPSPAEQKRGQSKPRL